MRGNVWHNWQCSGIPYTAGAGSSPATSPFIFLKKEEFKMKRLIDWFRKPAIMEKLFSTGGDWDGDLVTYKHHKYYVNAQTGVVIRIE